MGATPCRAVCSKPVFALPSPRPRRTGIIFRERRPTLQTSGFGSHKARRLMIESSSSSDREKALAKLSQRQIDCLRRVAELKKTEQIAEELGISPSTVNTHIERAMTILGAPSRREAARMVAAMPSTHRLHGRRRPPLSRRIWFRRNRLRSFRDCSNRSATCHFLPWRCRSCRGAIVSTRSSGWAWRSFRSSSCVWRSPGSGPPSNN